MHLQLCQEYALSPALQCFLEEWYGMERIENLISVLDFTLDTKRKRHITGGILLSISLLFGGLALTAMTLKMEDNYE